MNYKEYKRLMQMYGWGLSPSSKDKAPLTPPLKGENLITLIPSIHVQ